MRVGTAVLTPSLGRRHQSFLAEIRRGRFSPVVGQSLEQTFPARMEPDTGRRRNTSFGCLRGCSESPSGTVCRRHPAPLAARTPRSPPPLPGPWRQASLLTTAWARELALVGARLPAHGSYAPLEKPERRQRPPRCGRDARRNGCLRRRPQRERDSISAGPRGGNKSRAALHFAAGPPRRLRAAGSAGTPPSRGRLMTPLIGCAGRRSRGPGGSASVFICHLYVNVAIMEIVSDSGPRADSAPHTVVFEPRHEEGESHRRGGPSA